MNDIPSKFNQILDEFIVKLINQFPDEIKLTEYYKLLKMIKILNKDLPIKIYMSHALPVKEFIKNRDSQYFKNKKGFVKGLKENISFSSAVGLEDRWENLSEVSKNAIWDYTQTLFVLGEYYINNNNELLNEIQTYEKTTYEEIYNNNNNNNNNK